VDEEELLANSQRSAAAVILYSKDAGASAFRRYITSLRCVLPAFSLGLRVNSSCLPPVLPLSLSLCIR